MGTEDLKEKFLYSAYMAEILKLMHDCEEKAMKREIDISGKEKKEWVINKIHINLPNFYDENQMLIESMIDAFILIANDPNVILLEKSICNKIFSCCY